MAMLALIKRSVNFDCGPEEVSDFGVPQKFGFEFEAKGNFTFTWSQAMTHLSFNYLCGSSWPLMKELVRRTQYEAIPVLVNSSRIFKHENETFNQQLGYIQSKEVDVTFDSYSLHYILVSFSKIVYGEIRPEFTILGGIYSNTKSNPLFGVFNVFYVETWVMIVLTLLVSAWILAYETTAIFHRKTSSIEDYISIYGDSLWTVWNALFTQTYHFKNLNRWEYFSIIGVLLVTKVFVLTLFSSQILSITIDNPYVVIDSVEELNSRRDLEVLLFTREDNVPKFMRDDRLRPAIMRAMANNSENYLQRNFQKLFMDTINPMFNNISLKLSHVLVTSDIDSSHLISLNEMKYKSLTHIALHKYFDKMEGIVCRNETTKFIADHVKRLVQMFYETGLRRKMAQTAMQTVYTMFCDNSYVFADKESKDYMELDELKITLGPYLLGTLVAFLVLSIETVNYDSNKNPKWADSNKLEVKSKRRKHRHLI